MDNPVGFPLSGNPQTSETSTPVLHPSPSTNGSPLSENAQSSESPPNLPVSGNGPHAIFTPEEMHEQLGAMPFDDGSFRYMREGRCRDYFTGWYECMLRVVYNDEDSRCCLWLAGVLGDCMFENYDYYEPLLSHFRRRNHRLSWR